MLPGTICDNVQWSKILTRLRIGHSRLTHGFLMEQTIPPECPHCGEIQLTIKHILTICPEFEDIRLEIYGGPPSMTQMLTENISHGSKLYQFLTRINLFEEL